MSRAPLRNPGLPRVVAFLFALVCSPSILGGELVGEWRWEGKRDGVRIVTLSKYSSDGSYEAAIIARWFGLKKSFSCAGQWKWENAQTLLVEITESSGENYVPVGTIYRMEAFAIEGDQMRYRLDGAEETETRIEPEDSSSPNSAP